MKIKKEIIGDVTILRLEGKMLVGEGEELLREAITELTCRRNVKIIIDMEKVLYMDNAGLGEIVRSYTTASRADGELKLLNLTKQVHDLLAITKLLTVFDTYDDEEEAISSFQ